MRRPMAAVLLAAGQGVRMKSSTAKVLHELCGVTLIARALRAVASTGAEPLVIVVGYQADAVKAAALSALADVKLSFAFQPEPLGTGDAALRGVDALPEGFAGDVLITYADMPAMRADTLCAFAAAHRQSGAALSLVTLTMTNPASYGRVLRDRHGAVAAVVEAADASREQLAIQEINAGVYMAEANVLRAMLKELRPDNAQREYYLTDLVALARERGYAVHGWLWDQPWEFAGVNSRRDLAEHEARIRGAINRRLMDAGVTLTDPAAVYIGEEVEIGADSIIGPSVQICGRSRIGARVKIEGCAFLRDVTIGDDCHLKLGVRAEECRIGDGCEIGPFANLRPGTDLEGLNRVGNFVETKKARLGRGTKASHLSYLGDVVVGRETNIGCGVITVNYDGYDKHLTRIGSRCMVGCDSQLIAPVSVGDDAYVASGTTVRRDVSAGALAFCEHPQQEKSGWTAKWRKRHAGRAQHDD
jgi:bifunctional UDP-N-acetylglucosamine pyrophosphorylase/glucosamine-1-phosphate N-acetyltransferase